MISAVLKIYTICFLREKKLARVIRKTRQTSQLRVILQLLKQPFEIWFLRVENIIDVGVSSRIESVDREIF